MIMHWRRPRKLNLDFIKDVEQIKRKHIAILILKLFDMIMFFCIGECIDVVHANGNNDVVHANKKYIDLI